MEMRFLKYHNKYFWNQVLELMELRNVTSLSLTLSQFANYMPCSIDEAQDAIDDLVQCGICEAKTDTNGIITLSCKRLEKVITQNIADEEKRERARERQRLCRERKKQELAMSLVTSHTCHTNVTRDNAVTERKKAENTPKPLKEERNKEFKNIDRITNACACACEEKPSQPELPLYAETPNPNPNPSLTNNVNFKPKTPYPQSPEEVFQYVEQLRQAGRLSNGSEWTMTDAENFFGHYAANGWKRNNIPIVDWKSLIYSWNSNRINRNGMQKQEMERRTAVDKERIAMGGTSTRSYGGYEKAEDLVDAKGRKCVRIRGQLVPVNKSGEPLYFINANGERIGNTRFVSDNVYDPKNDFDRFKKSMENKKKLNIPISESILEEEEFNMLGHWKVPFEGRDDCIRQFFKFFEDNPHYNEGTEFLASLLKRNGWTVEQALKHTLETIEIPKLTYNNN